MSFQDEEAPGEPLDGRVVPSAPYALYRRLAHALPSLPWYAEYFVVGVAISPDGLTVLVEREAFGLEAALRPFLSEPVPIRVVGPIELVAAGGSSVGAGAGRQSSGTLGCLVEDATKTRFGLSCDHVVGTLAGQSHGDPVWAPGKAHGGTAASKIGTYVRGSAVVLSTGASNTVDGALIAFDTPSAHSRSITGIGTAPKGVNRSLAFGDDLWKSGATTGVTKGTFVYVVTLNIPYAAGTARFVDQIGIDGGGIVFARRGDSGAVVVDRLDRVSGLLFAAAPQSFLGFANPITDVEKVLGISVI
jgi:hypothetical protein